MTARSAVPPDPGASSPGHRHRHVDAVAAGRQRVLWWALGLNATYMVVEIVGAVVSGSLALAADAVHMASDVAALAVALVALRLTRRPPTSRYTYGWHRADVIGAQFNAALLLGAAGFIVVEAVRRVGRPVEIEGSTVVVIAAVGLAVNVVAAVLLSRHAGHSLNMRAALWHMASDALGSVAALGAGIAVLAAGATWVDLAASIFIAALVAWAAWRLLAESTAIVLEAAPASVDQADLVAAINDHPGVESVHHVHVWSIDAETTALSAHVLLADGSSLHEAQLVGDRLRALMTDRFGIDHATIEYECHICSDVPASPPAGLPPGPPPAGPPPAAHSAP